MKKKLTRKLWAWVEIVTTRLVIYWVLLIFKKNYRLTVNDLSTQTKLKDPQQINFIGKLENQAHGATMFFIIKNRKKLPLNFFKIL